MRDPLKDDITYVAARLDVPTRDLSGLIREGRRLKWGRRLAVTASGVLVIAGVMVLDNPARVDGGANSRVVGSDADDSTVSTAASSSSTPSGKRDWVRASEGPISTGGYVFSELRLGFAATNDTAAGPSYATLTGRIDFEDGFPGVKICTWRIWDGQDRLIGSAEHPFSALGPSTGLIKDRIDVTGVPSRVGITCSEDRLDDPSGAFSFTEIAVSRSANQGVDFDVSFIYEWEGLGVPSPQECVTTLYGPSGRRLFSTEQRFSAGQGPARSAFGIDAPTDADRPESAEIECQPFR